MAVFDENARNHVCIVGGGPAGVMLALILVRNGIPVTLVESQPDFDRDFRGDTLHAYSMEILAQLNLADPILELSNSKIEKARFGTERGLITLADFTSLESAYPFVALVPQSRFLERLVQEAGQYPNFRMWMNATCTGLMKEGGQIVGIECVHDNESKNIPAHLVIGADGRNSSVRQQAGMELCRTSPPMDVLWFKLPRLENMKLEGGLQVRFGAGTMLIIIDRGDHWQAGFIILKGSYRDFRKAGLGAFRESTGRNRPGTEGCILPPGGVVAMRHIVSGDRQGGKMASARPVVNRRCSPRHVAGRRGRYKLRYPGRGVGGECPGSAPCAGNRIGK